MPAINHVLKANIYPWHSLNSVLYAILFIIELPYFFLLLHQHTGGFEGLGGFYCCCLAWQAPPLSTPPMLVFTETHIFLWTWHRDSRTIPEETSLLSSTYEFVMINLARLLLLLSQTYVFDGPIFICIWIFCGSFKLIGL